MLGRWEGKHPPSDAKGARYSKQHALPQGLCTCSSLHSRLSCGWSPQGSPSLQACFCPAALLLGEAFSWSHTQDRIALGITPVTGALVQLHFPHSLNAEGHPIASEFLLCLSVSPPTRGRNFTSVPHCCVDLAENHTGASTCPCGLTAG